MEPLALMQEEMVTVSTEPSSNPLISCTSTDTSQQTGPCGDVNGSIPNAHVQQLSENRPRRKKFKPTNEQLSLLRQDHVQKTNKTVNLKRAHDFGCMFPRLRTRIKDTTNKGGQVQVMGCGICVLSMVY